MTVFSSSYSWQWLWKMFFKDFVCVCKDLSPDQTFSVQMELFFCVMVLFCSHITDVWGQAVIRSCRSLSFSTQTAFQLTTKQKGPRRGASCLKCPEIRHFLFCPCLRCPLSFRAFRHTVFMFVKELLCDRLRVRNSQSTKVHKN